MIELAEIDQGFEPIEFDHELPVDLIQITDVGIKRAKIQLNRFTDRRPDCPMVSMPITILPNDYLLVAPKSRSGDQDLKSNRRLKLGKIVLPIPEFAVSRIIGVGDGYTRPHRSKRLPYAKPNESHFKLVVGDIRKKEADKISKGELTFALRNKGVKAKDIQNILDVLVHQYGALQEIENSQTVSPSAGRKPSQEYQVLWGESELFPQLPWKTDKQE